MSLLTASRLALSGAFALIALGSSVAHAATLTVTSVGDTPDAVAGDGTCGATGVPNSCTLRAAIQEANANADASNTISFSGVSGQITVATALPNISKAVAIDGTGSSGRITVSGGDVASLFRFVCTASPCPSGGSYSIANLIVTDGRTTDAGGGGGIYFGAAGTVGFTLTNVDVTSSEATAGPGGGIAVVLVSNNSTLTLGNVRIGSAGASGPDSNGNAAAGDGGGLWVRFDGTTATMTIENASVVNNTSDANGGGIAVARGRLNVFESTLSGNTAAAKGGGLYLGRTGSAGGSARIENVTIAGNVAASGGGGGIGAASDNPAASSMTFTTITNNVGHGLALAADPNATFPGSSVNFPFTSNIIASNGDLECAAAFAHSDPDNSGYNLTNTGDGSCGFSAGNNDRFAGNSAELGLAALASNPSAPQTRALLAGSLAIDAGNPNWDTGGDQRGATTQDGGADGMPGDSTPVRDIGAYEFGGFGLVQFTLSAYDVAEDAGPAVATIKRYGAGTAILTTPTVVLSSTAGTATEGTCGTGASDYTELADNPMDFAFTASGATQFELAASFPICNDVAQEGDEDFELLLSEPATDTAGYDIGWFGEATITIGDAENGAFRFSPLAYAQNEGSAAAPGSATVTITRTGGADGAVRVSYATTSTCSPACSANPGADYTAASGTVDFADGQLSRTVTVTFVGDDAFEGNETFRVMLTGASCLGLAAGQGCDARLVGAPDAPERIATVTIGNDDAPVTGLFRFEFDSYTADEAAGTLSVKVKRVGGSDGAVSVDVAATNGTAAQGADFNLTAPLSGTLEWAAGDAADKTVTIGLVDDVFIESDKDFTLTLSNPQTSTAGLPAPTLSTPNAAAITLVSDEQPAFEFDIPSGGYRVNENGTSITLTVTWDAFTGQDVTVPYFTVDGTAISPLDYTGIPEGAPATLTATAGGPTSATFQVAIKTDAAAEGNETFDATLGTPQGGGALGAGTPATVTIVDPAGARFTAASFTRANEVSGGAIDVTVERFGDLTDPFTVDIEMLECTDAGCATQGDDYYRLAGTTATLSWNAGQGGTRTFTVNVQADTLIEGDETFALQLSNPRVGLAPATSAGALGLAAATGVVTDDDYRFEIVDVAPLAVAEGSGQATITVRRFGSTVGAASVGFATADGTAVAGSDYTATASPPGLSWAAGEGGTRTIQVPVSGDALDEVDEAFTVALSGPSNNAVGEATAIAGSPLTVQITDDDLPPVASFAADQGVTEGTGAGTTTVTVTVTLSAASAKAITVPYTVGGTAAAADHDAADGSIQIAAGQLSGSATFAVARDALDEDDEAVVFTMGTPTNATIGTGTHAVTVIDDDATPEVSFNAGQNADEGSGAGTTTATLTATLSAVSGRTVTVPYTVGGTAATADHNAVNGLITIAAGQSGGSVTVTIARDALDEPDETVTFTMGAPVNASAAAPTTHTITIVDDDAPPTVSFAASQGVAEGSGPGTSTATVTATLSAVSGRTVSVPYTVTGTAANPADYTSSAAFIVIAAGELSGSVTLTLVRDSLDEPNETVVFTMGTPTNATAAAPATHTVTIVDDDAGPGVTLAASTASVIETGGVATLTATLSAVSGQTVTVTLAFGGTATGTTDYTASATSITIPAGASSGSVTLTSLGDGSNEPDETIVADVTAVTNGVESGVQTQTVTITDDDKGGGGGSWSLLNLGLVFAAWARRRRGSRA